MRGVIINDRRRRDGGECVRLGRFGGHIISLFAIFKEVDDL